MLQRLELAFNSTKKLNARNSYVKFMNDKLAVLGKLFSRQCNAVAAQRVRRANQIMLLYNELYGDKSYRLLRKFVDVLKRKGKNPLSIMVGAVMFSWEDERVTDEDLKSYVDDMREFWDNHDGSSDKVIRDHEGHDWEKVVDNGTFKLWRCPVPNSHLYQYKAYGSYSDIPARAFFDVQVDLDYRKQWDSHVIKIEKVDEDKESGSELVYWATYFPLSFIYSRDYVYVRRSKVDLKNKMMILTAKSVQHPSYPVTGEYVRVAEYRSQMFIRPHKSFDENGFDYVMSYFDDPQLYVPYWAINKMTISSLPSFVATLHEAAKKLQHSPSTAVHPVDNQGTMSERILEAGKTYGFGGYENQQNREQA